MITTSRTLARRLLAAAALGALASAAHAAEPLAVDAPIANQAQDTPGAAVARQAADSSAVVVTASRTTRSAVALGGREIQKILPGVSPLKAIETLPGVLYETADPWGNNEQNESLFVHGFSTQQLGFTMDGVPLGSPMPLVTNAHAAGLLVHTWTFRPENTFLPAEDRNGSGDAARNREGSLAEIRRYLAAGIDGFFTDDPAIGRAALLPDS